MEDVEQENDEPRAKHRQVSSPENLDIGRRTVHLRRLAEGLAECRNPDCKQPLVLADATGEKRFSLGSVLAIPCRECKFVNQVDTDTRIATKDWPGPKPFTSNVTAAAGAEISRLDRRTRRRPSA